MHTFSCFQCKNFDSFNEDAGRGWCRLFDLGVRRYHQMTNDCILNGAELIEDDQDLDLPQTEFKVGKIVKIIVKDKPHQEWLTATVIANRFNLKQFLSAEIYLTQPKWWVQIIVDRSQSKWVKDHDICLANQSHLINTENIF